MVLVLITQIIYIEKGENGMLYSVITTLLWIVLGFVATYFQTKTNIMQQAKDFIVKAEVMYKDVTKSGSDKMEYCVDNIMKFIPEPFKMIFTRGMVEQIVQNVFDSIDRYAKTQLDKIVDNVGFGK